MKEVVILSGRRTPIGSFSGIFKDLAAHELGAVAIRQAVSDAGIKPHDIDECLMGCVLPAGLGQAPARQAMMAAGLPESVCATTVNRVCGSGLKTVMMAAQMIQSGDAQVVVAGGMENMTRAPYLLDKARGGYRMGHGTLIDSMIQDGLWDCYNNFHMGEAGELCADEKKFSREEQDRFAAQSYTRALEAQKKGLFESEITPVTVSTKKGDLIFKEDEEPGRGNVEKMPQLRPAFKKEGTITAANASSLSDGASAVVVASADWARSQGIQPMARIVAQSSYAHAPQWFTTAPIGSIKKVLEKAGLGPSDIDLFEINEAFAVVALAAIKELELPEQKVNVNGGAIALGHPLGASGNRILVTLMHAMKQRNKKRGLATLCIGGGEASALLIENLS